MSSQAAGKQGATLTYPTAIAFSVTIGRNQLVQALGITMVSLMGLTVSRWPWVLAWMVAAILAVGAEDQVLRGIAQRGTPTRGQAFWAPALRITATSIYALAALVLIARGGGGTRLFAFALMSASMVHVLMRYYRSPIILMASLTPYLAILALVGWGLMRVSLSEGHVLAALAPAFTIALFAVQFWSARAQLAAVWNELMRAREAAEQRQRAADSANRAKSQFLATMSHELRTPLNGVLGMAQALTSDRLTATQKERVSIIQRSSESLLSVLNDLLDLSKIETSGLELETVEFELEPLVGGVAAAYESLAAKKGVTLSFEVADAARSHYLGDSARIRRILYSLTDNAVKFTEEGGVSLRVDREDEWIVFRVADTGIGIDETDLGQLFQRFFQADGTLSRRYGGAGIGLAVCRELASLMGGTLEATSMLGVGSTFILKLPLAPIATPQAAPTKSTTTPAEMSEAAPDLRVLAAEDNVTNQLVLKTLLAPAGIDPVLTANGREALEAWEAQPWDIVLMDIQMPEMNGIEATRAIRAREAATGRPRTPIVAVTANAMTHQLAEYRAAGMDGVVAKPVDMATLFEVMEQALAGPSAAPERQSVPA